MKSGCDFNDRNFIKAMAESGKSAAEISVVTNIKLPVVEKFMPQAELTRGQKAAATRKANQEAKEYVSDEGVEPAKEYKTG